MVSEQEVAKLFSKNGIENAKNEAMWLFKYYSGDINDAIARRISGEPLQYILGFWEFMGLEFTLNKDTLIPRSDTEILCEEAIKVIKENNLKTVLDLCCGSGCIGISILNYCKDTTARLVDISKGALEAALVNAKRHNVSDRAEIMCEDILKTLQAPLDIVVCNPPYIPLDEYEKLSSSVKDYEPKRALLAFDNGYEFYEHIISGYKKYDNFYLMFECGYNQADEIYKMFENDGYGDIKKVKDYSGYDRVVYARK